MLRKKRWNTTRLMFGAVAASLAGSLYGQQNNPNIVLIFTDDQGYGDLGCYGAEGFTTPTIDSLAQQGVRFTSFYVSQAVSSASRAALLTGCYSNRVGVTGALTPGSDHGISDNELTIAEMLKEQGYVTGIFGKWHLGDSRKFLPLQHGFDEYVGFPYSNDMWPVSYDNKPLPKEGKGKSNYPPLMLIEGNERTKPFNSIEDMDSITTLLTDRAVDFINRNADTTFFLYFPHPMPHVPLGVSEKYAGKSTYGRYGDVIEEIDWSVSQVIKALEENGIADNTLIIYTSDNGPWKNFGTHAGTTGGFREGKGTSWEGGHRVPCIISWPGHIPQGMTINNLASTIDILPTLADITGGSLPEHTIDGVNILPLMMGDTASNPRNVFCYYYNDCDLEAVREGEWKLVFPHMYRSYEGVEPGKNGMPGKYNYGESGLELYNLRSDPFETDNVIDENPDVVKRLNKVADSIRCDLGDYLTGKEGVGVRSSGLTYDLPEDIEHLANGADVKLATDYKIKYSGRGPEGLVDGRIASAAFKDRSWQGYYGNNMDAIITFKENTVFDTVEVGTMKAEGSWIFLPENITVWVSEDGENFEQLATVTADNMVKTGMGNKYRAVISKHASAKAIRVVAKNIGECPPGHPAEGNPAWIFFDEIIVK